MEKIELPDYYDELVAQPDKIHDVAKQIRDYIDHEFETDDSCNIIELLFDNIDEVLCKWTGATYVGHKKEDALENAFQYFFNELYDLLIIMKESDRLPLREYANKVLYQGDLYRYLGGTIVNYNDTYVSWSKLSENSYIESKLGYPMIHLHCVVGNDMYGIDLKEFVSDRFASEAEVVFPTIETTLVKSDTKIIKSHNDIQLS